jgi:16S rRNA C1402 N4-methylase RsmH
MLGECMEALQVKPDGIYFDGTLGGGGHTEAILLKGGRVIATDLDDDAIKYASDKLRQNHAFENRFRLVKDNFKNALQVLEGDCLGSLDGAILDLGISSHQVDEALRGFSYTKDAALAMILKGILFTGSNAETEPNDSSSIFFASSCFRMQIVLFGPLVKNGLSPKTSFSLEGMRILHFSSI